MVEVPEHLLKRSRERRAALGLGGGDAPESGGSTEAESSAAPAAASAATPAKPAPAAPAPVEQPKPEPPKPVPAYVQAAQRRRRVPFWAMPVLAGLPLWAYVFFGTLEPQPEGETPLSLGEGLYSSEGCAGCHGAGGTGQGNVPGFTDGAVMETWTDYRDHMMWVRVGASGWPGDTYGDTGKAEVSGQMPEHPNLTDQELAQVVLYERTVSGADIEAEEPDLMAIAAGEMTFEEAGLGPASEAAGIPPDQLAGGS